jgi:glycosyltransferase involved in cell wall biosynthesis
VILAVVTAAGAQSIASSAACAALPAPLQPQVWIVGDGPERSALEALARQIYPQARFWGALFGADLETLFRQAHLFVLPGTGGLAVQQAMSYGLPVIVAEADGTQGSLVRPQSRLLILPGDLVCWFKQCPRPAIPGKTAIDGACCI